MDQKGISMKLAIGEYNDELRHHNKLILKTGWRSNFIQPDFGRFLAALLKKDFKERIGIEYMVVGGHVDSNAPHHDDVGDNGFRDRMREYFGTTPPPPSGSQDQLLPVKQVAAGKYWICAARLFAENIEYDFSDPAAGIPNKLRITFTFQQNAPTGTYCFEEFSLVGIEPNADNTSFNLSKLFAINYVSHGKYIKDNNVSLERTINLSFPPNS